MDSVGDFHSTFTLQLARENRRKYMLFQKPTNVQLGDRFKHHPPKQELKQAERYETVRATILSAAIICVDLTPCSPEQTRALNALDEAMFLFNAAIARNE